ncbi:ferritin-3, chloroplastic-like [Solanum lycopersicum]|uniref:ferritin-3, chloroplastic-like n=1 Tax=Solanum lycopersicum TaxID=4081 RepID=UPI000E1C4D86|nr:ferritin-3, chloroplastic-like [Solanum lycopersicum]
MWQHLISFSYYYFYYFIETIHRYRFLLFQLLFFPKEQFKLLCATCDVSLTGVVFEPFDEVNKEEFMVPITLQTSLARQRFADECEAAINEQINVEYNISYVYHAMYVFFDRDNVALKGLAKFFKESSEEEKEHGEKLMHYQNIRGGRVKLHSIMMPPSEFDHVDKGDTKVYHNLGSPFQAWFQSLRAQQQLLELGHQHEAVPDAGLQQW